MAAGVTEKEFWNMTPFQLETYLLVREEKFRYEKSLELLTLNTIRNIMSKNETISMDDLQGRYIKTYRKRLPDESRSDYIKYLKQEVEND